MPRKDKILDISGAEMSADFADFKREKYFLSALLYFLSTPLHYFSAPLHYLKIFFWPNFGLRHAVSGLLFRSPPRASDLRQRGIEIRDYIVNMLDSNREAHEFRADSRGHLLGLG